jgi:hypothetical protein
MTLWEQFSTMTSTLSLSACVVTFALILVSFVRAHDIESVLIESEERSLLCEEDAWALAFDKSPHGYLLGVFSLDAKQYF